MLKLNCYLDVSIENTTNPLPSQIAEWMKGRYVYILLGEAMILSEPDDTHLTLFNPDEQILGLVRDLAISEGLFVWEGKE